jgi:hypothetical protein
MSACHYSFLCPQVHINGRSLAAPRDLLQRWKVCNPLLIHAKGDIIEIFKDVPIPIRPRSLILAHPPFIRVHLW